MTRRSRSVVVPVTAFAIAAILLGIDAYQGAPPLAMALGFLVVLAYGGLIWFFQPNSETVSVMAGRPVDERWSLIHTRAMAASGTIAAVVAVAGFAIARATGRDETGFVIMCVVLGAGYLGALLWYRVKL